jgi:hypothetical protein
VNISWFGCVSISAGAALNARVLCAPLCTSYLLLILGRYVFEVEVADAIATLRKAVSGSICRCVLLPQLRVLALFTAVSTSTPGMSGDRLHCVRSQVTT